MDIITLIKELVTGLLNAEEEFLKHLDAFPKFEETVHELTDQMAADFMGAVLTNADTLIRESGKRKGSLRWSSIFVTLILKRFHCTMSIFFQME